MLAHIAKCLNILLGLLTALPRGRSTEGDDEWVDYTDMLRYDFVSQTMKRGADPCAKCYKVSGLWAPIVMLQHASTDDLLKIGLTLLLGAFFMLILHRLSRSFTRRAIRQRPPPSVTDAETQTDPWGEQGVDGSYQQMPQESGETSQHHQSREENVPETLSHSQGDFSHQREPAAREASMDGERPNLSAGAHDTRCLPMRGDSDGGTDSDSEEYCSARRPVPETGVER